MRALRNCSLVLVLALTATLSRRSAEDFVLPGYDAVAHLISAADFAGMTPRHQTMLVNLVTRPTEVSAAACWTGPLPWPVMDAFNQAIEGAGLEFQPTSRWQSTASTPCCTGNSDPITITYSFAPDGTFVPSGVGEPSGNSDLFAVFNGAFPSQQTWQDRFHEAFANWGAITGITYVYEPNDDGASWGSSGAIGVRGDVRIAGKSIDGSSGSNVLAYNSFPSGGGDMVLDTDNSGYFSTSTDNYRRLRNTVAHEHGHGIGLAHVCPTSQTKLMEPFISTAYDGPQLDDRLGAQRLYGDIYENNDSSATAADLGILANGTESLDELSIDDNSDDDWYAFTVTSSKVCSVTLTPTGSTYAEGVQTQACNTSNTIDTLTLNDIGFEIVGQNGVTVFATANSQPAGGVETLNNILLAGGAGQFYVHVFGGSSDSIQAYTLDITIQDTVPPPFTITFPSGVPPMASTAAPTTVSVQALDNTSSPDPTSGLVWASIDGAPYTSTPLIHLGGSDYEATLPVGACFTVLQWYVTLVPNGGGAPITGPEGAPNFLVNTTEFVDLPLVTAFADDFETDLGWTVTDDAGLTAGTWERGVPVGGGDRGDPGTDFDGSGQCYLTENVDGDSDVDNGSTTLTSPAFDLSMVPTARISFAFWYDNEFGSLPNADFFDMQISDNGGGTWVTMESYNGNANQWLERSFRVGDFVSLTGNVRVRFVVSDLPGQGSVVEAGLDDFRVEVCTTGTPPPTPPVLTEPCAAGNIGVDLLTINFSAGGVDRRVDVAPSQSSLLAMGQPPAMVGIPAQFVLFAKIGPAPGAADVLDIGLGIGQMCFSPCLFNPLDPALVTVTNSFGGLACNPTILPAGPTPWIGPLPPLGVQATITLQGIILKDPVTLGVTNAVILYAF